jgi:predicted nuclease of predicted toxin-antitoxin system
VKLLLDENLSPRLCRLLADAYPKSTHVRDIGLRGADDDRLWVYARDNEFTLVSKDNDFRQLSFLRGSPPKIVWLAVGNAPTAAIADLLLRERSRLLAFADDAEAALLVLPIFGAF